MAKKIIPVAFAVDDNYAPYLIVALESLVQNSSKDNDYKIYVLYEQLSDKTKNVIKKYEKDNFTVDFIDVTKNVNDIKEQLFTRDYYTNTTYYRFFIPKLFPNYEKVLYLDADIIITDDIAKLYDHDLEDNYLGGAVCDIFMSDKNFGDYSEQVLGVPQNEHLAAGILVLNVPKLLEIDLEKRFVELLNEYKFILTQDQDYLNVICRGHIKFLNLNWNKSPVETPGYGELPYIIHYKLPEFKPWKSKTVKWGDEFWKYAKNTEVYELLKNMQDSYSDEEKAVDDAVYGKLVDIANKETAREDSYFKIKQKNG